ncbi:GNAT family N-acetyltransferase [Phenylobacterium sp.]|uniref:GNAT family N-acetyltransferase n=1 Tax=Phenylobacterium sp. TaxID=1871053 RepID=UPI0027335FB0|nr:GNAT family N-acetyltransferase [Phenylobacterium sp.]MDP3590502.1 GNAT family N-acetyltransferase [Phenylobacterium sp.]
MTSPRLETARLLLRPPIDQDLDGWADLDADPRAVEFIGGLKTRNQAWMDMATAAGMWSLRGCGLFSVIEKDTGRWVGRVGPWLPEGAIGTEVGWAISPTAWGKGYATEAAHAAIAWACDHLGWTDVIHCIDAPNAASIAVAERLGSTWLRADREAGGKEVQIYGQSREASRAANRGNA